MPRSFHIVTIANDLAQYAAMRAAFEAAGFTDAVARYTLFDNSADNVAEPYGLLRGLATRNGEEAYVILCHQDVRPDLGHTATDLMARLNELTDRHPHWALAGNAGATATGHWVLHLDEPVGRRRAGRLPAAARSLDENFLVLRQGVGPLASDGLSGFHLYGTDACLVAASRGRGAYVIDFLLTHLSKGNPHSPGFRDAERALVAAWRPRVWVGLVRTTCTELRFSRSPWIERQIQRKWTARLLRRIGCGVVFAKKSAVADRRGPL